MSWIRFNNFIRNIFQQPPVFLCDSCRYDYGNVCLRPERPNAVKCPDYKKG